jgi:uncharacterized cupredoxin-like copper-binding protein
MDMEDDGIERAVHMAVEAGEQYIVIFTPTKAGTYPFECTVEGHAAAGMVGELVVEP